MKCIPKSSDCDNVESLVAVLLLPKLKYPIALDAGKKAQRLSKVVRFYLTWLYLLTKCMHLKMVLKTAVFRKFVKVAKICPW